VGESRCGLEVMRGVGWRGHGLDAVDLKDTATAELRYPLLLSTFVGFRTNWAGLQAMLGLE